MACESEAELIQIERMCQEAAVESVKFFEPDDQMGWTSLTTRPVVRDERHLFRQFKLWGP